MSDSSTINSLSPLHTIQSTTLRGSRLELQWIAEDDQSYEIQMPFVEACRLVGVLQDVLRPGGRNQNDRSKKLASSIRSKVQSTTLAPVDEFKGVYLSGIFAHLQWEVASGDCYELKIPFQMALCFLDTLEETLPLDRKPQENILLKFDKAIAMNDFAGPWRVAYRADRYLKELTAEALDQRVAGILANAMRLDDDRKLRPIWFTDENGFYRPDRDIDWLRLLTDTHTELGLRGRLDRKLFPTIETSFPRRLDDETWCRRPDLVQQSSELRGRYIRPKMFFKFGEKKWNERIMGGRIRLRPASDFKNDGSKNPAIRDDELRFSCSDEGNILREYRCDDYYVFCVSGVYDYRLYRDFKSDSCLVIRDAEEFGERIRKATLLNLPTKVFGVVNAPVVYVDPFRIEKPEQAYEIWLTKHFQYAYQHEFRFVWPPRVNLSLAPFELNIGDLSDITELIARDSN